MKVAILSFYSGKVSRGVETFVKELSLRLEKRHKVVVYQPKGSRKSEGYRKVIIPMKFSLEKKINKWLRKFYLDYYSLKILFFTLKVLRYLVSQKPDVLLPTNNGWQSLICKIYSLLFRVPLVVVGNAGMGWDDFLNLKLSPDVFICFTQGHANWARRVNRKVRIEIIPHGVDLRKFNSGVKPKKITLAKPIILCVSALDDYKRVDLVIKATYYLKGSLLLITHGTEQQKEKISRLGKSILDKRFQQIEAKYHQLPAFYKTADLFTLVSSSKEAFGIVYLEAMASGLPVVATDDSLRREIIGRAGLFVKEPIDIKDYSSVLQKALETSWRNLPKRQAEKFSWDKIAKEYERVFLSLLPYRHPEGEATSDVAKPEGSPQGLRKEGILRFLRQLAEKPQNDGRNGDESLCYYSCLQ